MNAADEKKTVIRVIKTVADKESTRHEMMGGLVMPWHVSCPFALQVCMT